MATVTIRNLDNETVDALKARARTHHRSLEAELRLVLRDAAIPMNREQFRARALEIAKSIAAMTPEGVQQIDSTLLIREDRDNR